jgi:hypothetical protein
LTYAIRYRRRCKRQSCVEVERIALPEGAVIAVVALGADAPFALTPEDEDELLAAISEIERGEYLTIEQLPGKLC